MPIVVAILGVIIIIMGVAFFLMPTPSTNAPVAPVVIEDSNRTEEMEKVEEQVVSTVAAPEPTPVTVDTVTLSEDITYLTPARTEHKMGVTLTLEDGVVTDASIIYDDGEGFSNQHQERFDNAYKAEVIGKSLADISLSRVGGASLTSQAFNDAVKKMMDV